MSYAYQGFVLLDLLFNLEFISCPIACCMFKQNNLKLVVPSP